MRKSLKTAGSIVGTLFVLVIMAGTIFYLGGQSDTRERREVTPAITSVEVDSGVVARGAHLSKILSCNLCHGEQLQGKVFTDAPPFLAVATNLTSGTGGVGRTYTDADWDRAIRHGVKPNGQQMVVMPSALFHALSDEDARAIIAYIKSLPPVDNELPATELRPPLFLMAGLPGGEAFPNLPPDDAPAPPGNTVENPSREYGAYLARVSCVACHGLDLRGGEYPEPGAPGGPDLAAAGQWSLEDFKRAMREGTTPYGVEMRTKYMPWSDSFRHMTDLELEALHRHLATLAG